ncbi:DNA-binding MarR family transcriptional regulator [Ochrobactrum daejeonense]|uniref:DNA-binding MarR family transcriptional regulator n=1 Tax=Brucella daejeonensis TaxID=659015 RepID=A0A7W9AX38_9HYPH|nr:MarR family transcriptional regulator [Brucella daejeonensis]MBB5702203.1 DNA-binding MarR family transcriptional regulator [Brucella daejeonensis]
MEERFSGQVLASSNEKEPVVRTLGEIGLNGFAPYLMNRLMARYNADLADSLKAKQITTAKLRALAVLSVTPSATINELSVFTVTEQSTMSRTLDSLEEQGYIRRQARAEDMRVRDISITEQGRAIFDETWPVMYESLLKMFAGIDEDEHRAFVGTLQKMLHNIRKNEI